MGQEVASPLHCNRPPCHTTLMLEFQLEKELGGKNEFTDSFIPNQRLTALEINVKVEFHTQLTSAHR